MENYKKGKNVEEPLERDEIPVQKLPKNFLWMQVRGSSKIRNLLTRALGDLPTLGCVVWTAYGPAVGKAITCAEIMKRECGNTLHQITKLEYKMVEEYWDPLISELDQLVVKRKLPMIHIVLSQEKINNDTLGYQAPGTFVNLPSSSKNSKENSTNKGARKHKMKKKKNKTDS